MHPRYLIPYTQVSSIVPGDLPRQFAKSPSTMHHYQRTTVLSVKFSKIKPLMRLGIAISFEIRPIKRLCFVDGDLVN